MLTRLRIPSLSDELSLYVHEQGDLVVSERIREAGIWEPYETHLIVKALQSATNFVDVGANIGYYSVIAASLLRGKGRVFSFEPEPANFSLLEKSIAANKFENVEAVSAGLSDEKKSSVLYLSADNYGDHQVYDRGEEREKKAISLLNGSDFLAAKIASIDVLKIDTQGAEFGVIKGLAPLIEKSPKIKMVVEFWPFGLKKAGHHAHHLLDLLLGFDLPMFIIDHIEHKLIPCKENDLRPWIDELDVDDKNEGFLNLYLGEHDECIDAVNSK